MTKMVLRRKGLASGSEDVNATSFLLGNIATSGFIMMITKTGFITSYGPIAMAHVGFYSW